MNTQHFLITGGAGFIGSHLTEDLLSLGHKVTVIDNFDPFYNRNIKEKNLSNALHHPNLEIIEGDIRNFDFLTSRLTVSYDAIIHLAAKAGVRPSMKYPQEYSEVNVYGTLNLLELAKKLEVKQFVFASSSSVYGVNPNYPWKESDQVLLPISPYASSKVSAELLGHVYSHLYNIRFIGLRFFTVYGPRQRPDLAIHKFTKMMLQGEKIPVYGDGSTLRDYTFVSDIVFGIKQAIDYKASMYELINLGNHRTVSLSEMIETIERVFQVEANKEWLPQQPGDVPITYADVSLAKELLNYQPQTSFEEGIKLFKAWYDLHYYPSLLSQ